MYDLSYQFVGFQRMYGLGEMDGILHIPISQLYPEKPNTHVQKKKPNSSIHVPLFWQGDDAQSSNDGCVTGLPVEELNVDLGVGSWTCFVVVEAVGPFVVETVGPFVVETVGPFVVETVVLLLASPGPLVVIGGAVVVFVVVDFVVVVDEGVVSANDFVYLEMKLVERHYGDYAT